MMEILSAKNNKKLLHQLENKQLLKQRSSALNVAIYGTATAFLVAIIQLTYVFGLADHNLFTASGVKFSGFLNLILFPLGLLFYLINYTAQRKWQDYESVIYRISLLILLVTVMLQSLGHVYNAGLSNSAISGYFIMIVTLAAWFLPIREFRIFIAITILCSTILFLMEIYRIIPYAPVFAENNRFEDIFLSPEIAFGSYAMVVIWTVLISWIVRYVRLRLQQSNIMLEEKVLKRTMELEKAQEREKQLNKQLAHVSRVASLGELTASIAHELNQPLAAILTNSSAGLRISFSASPNMKSIQDIFSDIKSDDRRAAETIRTLQQLFRFGNIKREPISIKNVIDDIRILVHNEIKQHRIVLRVKLEENIPEIQADRVQIDHLLMNLLRNSIDAMLSSDNADKIIDITAKTNNTFVTLSVKDSGPGFNPELHHKLFESFITTKPDGLGIGLSLCKTIIEHHRGMITADNHPDGGAIITISIPMMNSERK